MTSLRDFIVETGGYKNYVSGKDWYKDLGNHKFVQMVDKLGIKDLIDDFVNSVFDEPAFTYADDAIQLKINRSYNKEVEEYCKTHDEFSKQRDNIKVNGKLLFYMGNGSIGQATTPDQENATVILWNEFVENGIDLDDEKIVNAVLADLPSKFNKAWLKSFKLQIESLTELLPNWREYKATRYGDGPVGEAYADFVDDVVRQFKKDNDITSRVMKDSIDPTDIILYKDERIAGKLYSIDTIDQYKELIKKGDIYGISLKQAKGTGRAEYRNFDNANYTIKAITNIKPITKTETGGSYTTVITFEVGNDEYRFEFRPFGRQGVGMDVKKGRDASLGKVPKWLWSKYMQNDPVVGGEQLVTIAKQAQETGKYHIFDEFFKYGAKMGTGVPYILVH